jgi:hypothetical protein
MAEREGLGGVSPKVFAEIKDAQPEVTSAISLKDYITSAVEAASGDFKGLAIEHKEFFDKTIRESDELTKEEHDKVMEKLSFLENNMNAQFTALSAKLDVVIEFTKVNIKVTRVEGEKKGGGPMAAADREAIEIAAYKKGFDKAQADGIKARKSIVTQLGNLRKAYHELRQHAPPDEDIEEDYEEGAAETAEEQRERKEKAKEQARAAQAEVREERQDGEWGQRPFGQPRPPLPGIQIPAKKRSRNMASGPIKPVVSSSSSSAAGAAPPPMSMPTAHHRLKVFCDDCQAASEEECVCAKE